MLVEGCLDPSIEYISESLSLLLAEPLNASVLILISTVHRSSGCYQIRQPLETQQEAQGEPLLRNRDPQRTTSSSYRCPHRLPGITDTHKSRDGILRAGRSVILHQEERQACGQSSSRRYGSEIPNAAGWRSQRGHCPAFPQTTG